MTKWKEKDRRKKGNSLLPLSHSSHTLGSPLAVGPDSSEGGLTTSDNVEEGESDPLTLVTAMNTASMESFRRDFDLNEFVSLAAKVFEKGDPLAMAEMVAVHDLLQTSVHASVPPPSLIAAPPLVPCVDSPPRIVSLNQFPPPPPSMVTPTPPEMVHPLSSPQAGDIPRSIPGLRKDLSFDHLSS
ncbi:hypothetical protein Salat_2279100 [Sesamum alatum]|uniref:Uncharacterized protein n=1 Tax=Sesamum alatum TaxID=300844 RepID=A0AAE1XW74_9LAMI|nr:hypothetical protein Salat_2279100 [Sesamum alatum]